MIRKVFFICFIVLLTVIDLRAQTVNLVFVSDLHYGITRPHFRGRDSVPSYTVNNAMVQMIDTLPRIFFPADKGVQAGKQVQLIKAIVVTGDIANRQEPPVQPATASWQQFIQDYQQTLHYPLLPVPGNHDVSNAIGSYKILQPKQDATAITGIYNLVMKQPIKPAQFNFEKNKVNYSRDMGGVHLLFIQIWPDSANRLWMEKDLATVNPKTPVLLFVHDPPQGDVKHFINPHGAHDMNAQDKFENLVDERYKDTGNTSTLLEQQGLAGFLKKHPNIKAWFHGHENYCEMYDYKGPGGDLSLPVFRADSPMKGRDSRQDEYRLSLQVISFNQQQRRLTVRELLWNLPNGKYGWGQQRTIQF